MQLVLCLRVYMNKLYLAVIIITNSEKKRKQLQVGFKKQTDQFLTKLNCCGN